MEYTNDAIIKTDSYRGKGYLEYSQEQNLFTLRKNPGSSGAGIAIGMAFGALGRMVYEGMATGKVLLTFPPEQIRLVTTSEAKRKCTFYLYTYDSQTPMEVTLEQNTQMYTLLQQIFADRMEGVTPAGGAPKKAAAQAPQQPQYQAPQQPKPQAQPKPQPQPQPKPQPQPQPKPQPAAAAPQSSAGIPGMQLHMRTGPLAGRSLMLAGGSSIVIGRDPARCDLALPQYPAVSGVHCRITVGNDCLWVADMNSSNGSFINNQRLPAGQACPLYPGEYLMLASNGCVLQITMP